MRPLKERTEKFQLSMISWFKIARVQVTAISVPLFIWKRNSFIILLKNKIVDSYHFIKLPVHDL